MPLVSCAQSLRQIMLCRTARSVAGRGVHAACRAVDLPAAHDKVSPAAPHALNIHRFLHRSKLSWNYLTSKGGSDKITSLTLEDIALGIKDGTYRRILVMVGAGISTDSGIPDFRSPTNGLYSKLEEYNLPYPQAIFELSYFLKEPHAFLHLSKELLPGRHLPNTAHYFLRLLSDKRLLIRIYTQNIDGLERAVGIPLDKLVEAHGSFTSSTCTRCLRTCPGKVFQDAILESRVPLCKLCGGLIKPDIVFFGEQLPPRFLMHLVDFPQAHLLLVIGTSLEVEPFASLVYEVKAPIPRVLINREAVGPFLSGHQGVNVSEIGEVTAGIKRFAQLLGWEHDLNEMEKAGKDGSDQM